MSDTIMYAGDEGLDITVTVEEDGVPVDLGTADVMKLQFRRPGGAVAVEVTAVHVTDGSDGKIEYTTEAAFLTPAGRWGVQAYIEFTSSGQKWHTSISEFIVREPIA